MAKSDDVENCFRQNNDRVLGFPESAGVTAESFFKDILGLQSVPPTYVVERAHRVPMGRQIPGAPPCPFLVKFLNFQYRGHILSKSRKQSALKYENPAVHFYPDFSADLQKKRKRSKM